MAGIRHSVFALNNEAPKGVLVLLFIKFLQKQGKELMYPRFSGSLVLLFAP